MFGHRYFGAVYLAQPYFGQASGTPVSTSHALGNPYDDDEKHARAIEDDDEEALMVIAAALPLILRRLH